MSAIISARPIHKDDKLINDLVNFGKPCGRLRRQSISQQNAADRWQVRKWMITRKVHS